MLANLGTVSQALKLTKVLLPGWRRTKHWHVTQWQRDGLKCRESFQGEMSLGNSVL